MTKASENQPDPKKGTTRVLDLVRQDLTERAKFGKKKYGTFLMTNNGRDATWDAYQEVLDLAMYFRQLIEENEVLNKTIEGLEEYWKKENMPRSLSFSRQDAMWIFEVHTNDHIEFIYNEGSCLFSSEPKPTMYEAIVSVINMVKKV